MFHIAIYTFTIILYAQEVLSIISCRLAREKRTRLLGHTVSISALETAPVVSCGVIRPNTARIRTMVHISGGNSEIGAHVSSENVSVRHVFT